MRASRFRWAVLIALCSGQFIMVLDSTPPIVTRLEANYAQSQVDALKIAVGGVALIGLSASA